MGTDIHLVAEKRVNGVWVNATRTSTRYSDEPYLDTDQFYSGRNYDVFAILANVRNGHGFAGVDTGNGFNYISEPRGFPDDMSPEVKSWSESADHTPSWLTVDELMAFDWTQTTRKRGVVGSISQIGRWKMHGHPDSYSGGVSGGGIKTIGFSKTVESRFEELMKQVPPDENGRAFDWWSVYHANDPEYGRAEVEPRVKKFKELLKNEFQCETPYFQLEWETPYYDAASMLLSQTLPKLWRLGKPEDVRIVFYFDS